MKTIDKIDVFLKKMDEKSKKRKKGILPFLFKTEDLEFAEVDLETQKSLLEKSGSGKEYDAFFKKMLKKYKVKSYKDLPKDKQKKFFNEVDKAWKAKKETD